MRFFLFALAVVGLFVGCAKTDGTQTGSKSSSTATETSGGDTGEESYDSKAMADAEEGQAADEFNVGDPAPKFKNLAGVDDKQHSLEDYADAKAVAVVFTCNHCPVAKAYEDRLVKLHDDYSDQGVQIVAINVNNLEADRLPAMKERATEKGFQFPYLYDPMQKVGREYGATVTPHIFLLDQKRQLAYVGPIDDNPDEKNVSKKYLRNAIDAVLAGKKPEPANVEPVGCGIKYE